MLRELIRTIVSAFKMFTRIYRRWFVFGLLFSLLFLLIGFLLSVAVFVPLGMVFHPEEIDLGKFPGENHLYWVFHCSNTAVRPLIFSVGLLGAYLQYPERRGSLSGFLRFVPAKAWRLFFMLSLAGLLVAFGAIHFDLLSIHASAGELKTYGLFITLIEVAPMLIIYVGAAWVYMTAAGIRKKSAYIKNVVVFQIADLLLSLSITFCFTLATRAYHQISGGDPQALTWGNAIASLIIYHFGNALIILFYGCLVRCAFNNRPEDVEIELENNIPEIIVIKN